MASDICVVVGGKIRLLRQRQGWRQIDLAEHAGVNPNYISDLEIGKKEPCLRTLKTVADALGITLSELFHDI